MINSLAANLTGHIRAINTMEDSAIICRFISISYFPVNIFLYIRLFSHFYTMKRFAICLTRHRVLGQIFIPVIFKQIPGKAFFTIDERIHTSNLRKFEHELQSDELQLVNLIEEYADNHLVKIFSKKKINPQNFLAALDDNILSKQIRPYIENRLIKCIEILHGSEIPVYRKDMMNNVYESDRIIFIEESVESVFNFKRVNGELSYFLSIRQDEQEIELFGKKGIILINEPCCLVLDNYLYTFEDIDGKKLLPFFNKEFIQVPRKTEKKFLEGFVKNVIKNYRVNTDGFKIVDKNVHPTAILSLESDLSGSPAFLLK